MLLRTETALIQHQLIKLIEFSIRTSTPFYNFQYLLCSKHAHWPKTCYINLNTLNLHKFVQQPWHYEYACMKWKQQNCNMHQTTRSYSEICFKLWSNIGVQWMEFDECINLTIFMAFYHKYNPTISITSGQLNSRRRSYWNIISLKFAWISIGLHIEAKLFHVNWMNSQK